MVDVQVFEGDGKMTPEWEAIRDENSKLKEELDKANRDADILKEKAEELIREKYEEKKKTDKLKNQLDTIIINQRATIKDLLEQRNAAENKINDVHLALSGALLPEGISPRSDPHDDAARYPDPDDDRA